MNAIQKLINLGWDGKLAVKKELTAAEYELYQFHNVVAAARMIVINRRNFFTRDIDGVGNELIDELARNIENLNRD
jgi:hypothetical protein